MWQAVARCCRCPRPFLRPRHHRGQSLRRPDRPKAHLLSSFGAGAPPWQDPFKCQRIPCLPPASATRSKPAPAPKRSIHRVGTFGRCNLICFISTVTTVHRTMTGNRDPEAAWTYHQVTKHSYASIRTNPHFMDWSNQPLPFKIYPTLEPMRLPGEFRQTGVAALSAISRSVSAHRHALPDLEAVAQLLYLSAGITRKRKYSGGEIFFRAAACTGALYEVELYLVCGGLPNLDAGVYHFAPAELGLRLLRAGDYRGVLLEATGGQPAIVLFFFNDTATTTFCTLSRHDARRIL